MSAMDSSSDEYPVTVEEWMKLDSSTFQEKIKACFQASGQPYIDTDKYLAEIKSFHIAPGVEVPYKWLIEVIEAKGGAANFYPITPNRSYFKLIMPILVDRYRSEHPSAQGLPSRTSIFKTKNPAQISAQIARAYLPALLCMHGADKLLQYLRARDHRLGLRAFNHYVREEHPQATLYTLPCVVCKGDVHDGQQGAQCTVCMRWCHAGCDPKAAQPAGGTQHGGTMIYHCPTCRVKHQQLALSSSDHMVVASALEGMLQHNVSGDGLLQPTKHVAAHHAPKGGLRMLLAGLEQDIAALQGSEQQVVAVAGMQSVGKSLMMDSLFVHPSATFTPSSTSSSGNNSTTLEPDIDHSLLEGVQEVLGGRDIFGSGCTGFDVLPIEDGYFNNTGQMINQEVLQRRARAEQSLSRLATGALGAKPIGKLLRVDDESRDTNQYTTSSLTLLGRAAAFNHAVLLPVTGGHVMDMIRFCDAKGIPLEKHNRLSKILQTDPTTGKLLRPYSEGDVLRCMRSEVLHGGPTSSPDHALVITGMGLDAEADIQYLEKFQSMINCPGEDTPAWVYRFAFCLLYVTSRSIPLQVRLLEMPGWGDRSANNQWLIEYGIRLCTGMLLVTEKGLDNAEAALRGLQQHVYPRVANGDLHLMQLVNLKAMELSLADLRETGSQRYDNWRNKVDRFRSDSMEVHREELLSVLENRENEIDEVMKRVSVEAALVVQFEAVMQQSRRSECDLDSAAVQEQLRCTRFPQLLHKMTALFQAGNVQVLETARSLVAVSRQVVSNFSDGLASIADVPLPSEADLDAILCRTFRPGWHKPQQGDWRDAALDAAAEERECLRCECLGRMEDALEQTLQLFDKQIEQLLERDRQRLPNRRPARARPSMGQVADASFRLCKAAETLMGSRTVAALRDEGLVGSMCFPLICWAQDMGPTVMEGLLQAAQRWLQHTFGTHLQQMAEFQQPGVLQVVGEFWQQGVIPAAFRHVMQQELAMSHRCLQIDLEMVMLPEVIKVVKDIVRKGPGLDARLEFRNRLTALVNSHGLLDTIDRTARSRAKHPMGSGATIIGMHHRGGTGAHFKVDLEVGYKEVKRYSSAQQQQQQQQQQQAPSPPTPPLGSLLRCLEWMDPACALRDLEQQQQQGAQHLLQVFTALHKYDVEVHRLSEVEIVLHTLSGPQQLPAELQPVPLGSAEYYAQVPQRLQQLGGPEAVSAVVGALVAQGALKLGSAAQQQAADPAGASTSAAAAGPRATQAQLLLELLHKTLLMAALEEANGKRLMPAEEQSALQLLAAGPDGQQGAGGNTAGPQAGATVDLGAAARRRALGLPVMAVLQLLAQLLGSVVQVVLPAAGGGRVAVEVQPGTAAGGQRGVAGHVITLLFDLAKQGQQEVLEVSLLQVKCMCSGDATRNSGCGQRPRKRQRT